MSLQIALVAIGALLIIAVYLISMWLDQGKSTSVKSTVASSNQDMTAENSDANDDNLDDIPVLDCRVSGASINSGAVDADPQWDDQQDDQQDQQVEMSQAEDDLDYRKWDEMVENVAKQQYVTDTHAPESELDSTSASYSDGFYSLQIPKRSGDLEWMDAASLTDLTDDAAELDRGLHESMQSDFAVEYAQKEAEQVSEQSQSGDVPDETELSVAVEDDVPDNGLYGDEVPAQDNSLETVPESGTVPERETEQPLLDTVQVASPSHYSYPNIDGFDRISQIDYWVRLHGESDIGREAILAQFRQARSVLSKDNRILGLKIPEKNWCDLEKESEDARFGDIIVTLQLADQQGAVSETELQQFSNLVANLARGTNRLFAFMAPLDSAWQQANAIADFIRYYQAMFVVNVMAQGTDYLNGSVINQCATQLGFKRNANNYFVRNKMRNKAEVCLYSLANMSDSGEFDFENLADFSTRGVIFFTKLGVNHSPGAVFSEMVHTAKAFAGRIKGDAVAPNCGDLSEETVRQIRLSIEQVAEDMTAHGMMPGSDEAVRIF